MSQVIPGGRPRASSDGDILDEGLCGPLFVNLSERHGEIDRKSPGKVVHVNNNSSRNSNCLDLSTDAFDSDGEVSSQSQNSFVTSRRTKFFKSMRKVVTRAFVNKESSLPKFNEPLKRVDKLRANNLSKIWTPDLRQFGEGFHGKNQSSDEQSDSGTMSTARPLITDPTIGIAVPKWKKTPGTIGIYNHGNSCFMNAVLQCLSNTDSFTEYFIRDLYKNDLKNSKNGKKSMFRSNYGEVTEHLGLLLKGLWSGKYTSDISKEFKSVVGKLNAQYKGDHQHDAQEFLLWLLDRVHEDVSIFTKRKNKPQKTPVLRTDDELATEAAAGNGESFVLKLFQALHSSTLICATCGERSSTFDPYLCVSLPLPQRCPKTIFVVVVPLKSYQSLKYAVILNQFDGVRDLRERVAVDAKINATQLLLVEMKDDGFGSTYSDEQPLSDIGENETVYAIETFSNDISMNSSVQEFDMPMTQVLVSHVEVMPTRCLRFGSPALIRVRRDITWKDLQKEILTSMEDAVCEEIFGQKLSTPFMMRIYDGSSRKSYLPADVEMPLYSQPADRAYSTLDEDFGPPHLKIIAEWDPKAKKTIVKDDEEHIGTHTSVIQVQSNPPGQGKVSLEECFKLYTQEERLTGDDAWLCPHCKQQQQGTIKTLGLWSLPDILVLHLKRFKQTGLRRSKLNTLVEFPIDNLDMSGHLSHRVGQSYPLKKDDYTYDLIGVSNHHGNMMGGHYIAFCRSPVDGKWREFNDHKVTLLEGGIATKEAYLLFYQRRSLSKDINQRLFTCEHWVFSLNLAPGLEEVTSSFSDTSKEDTSYPPKRSRSRSASPSAHKQSKENPSAAQRRSSSRPLTPQLSRRPVMPYADDNEFYEDSSPGSPPSPQREGFSRISRPVQRQTSEPYSRRQASAGPSSSTATKIKDTKWKGIKDDSSLIDLNKNIAKAETTNGFRRRDSEKHKQKPKVTVIRHEPTKSSTLPMNMSRNIGPRDLESDAPRDLESDARYPENNSYPSGSRQISSSYESPSFLQVKLAQDISWDRFYDNSRGSEEGRRKLAQLMKQESFEKSLGEIGMIKEEPPNLVRTGSTKVGPFKNNILSSNYPKNSSTNGFSAKFDNHDTEFEEELLNHRQDISLFKYRPHTTSRGGYSHLDEDYEPVLEKRPPKPPWRADQFHRLAQQHFGGRDEVRPYNKEKYGFTDDIYSTTDRNFNGDLSPIKYATMGRTRDFLERDRLDADVMPRSITLPHMITNIQIDVQPPPSPTPPHTLKEERTYGHSTITSLPFSTSEYFANARISNRERSSIVTYEQHGRRTSDQSTFSSGSRTLPSNTESRPRFRPPRGIWGTIGRKPTPAATVSNIPTPCLRESSV